MSDRERLSMEDLAAWLRDLAYREREYLSEVSGDEPGVIADRLEQAAELVDRRARVLTLKELRKLPRTETEAVPVVIEEKYPIEAWDKGSHFKWCGSDFVIRVHLRESHLVGAYVTEETCGKVWRVWSWMPTMEQADEVKWEASDD